MTFWIIAIATMALSFWAAARVKSVYRKYSKFILLLGIVFTAGCTQSPQPRVPLQSSVPEIHPVEIRDHVQNKNEGKEPAGDLADGPKTILTCSLTGESQPFRTPETIYSHFPK